MILTGAGKAFCVGADLSAMTPGEEGKSLGDQTAEWMQSLSNPLIETLRTHPDLGCHTRGRHPRSCACPFA